MLGGSTALRRSDVAATTALVAADLFAMYEAFMLSYTQRAADPHPLAHYVSAYGFSLRVLAIVPLWVLVFGVCGLYSSHLNRSDRHHVSELTRIVVAVAGGVMCLIVWDYLSPNTRLFPSRSVPVWAIVYGVGLVLLGRILVRLVARTFLASGFGLHNVILVGTGVFAQQIAREMRLPGQGYRIIGAVDPSEDGGRFEGNIPVHSSLEAAVTANPGERIDEVMQADVDLDRSEIARMIQFANTRGISYRFVPDHYGVYAAASSATTVAGVPVLEVRLTSLDGWGAIGKRAFDLVGSVVLTALLSPVLLAVAGVIKLSEPSAPVFYAQQRLGKNGRPIRVLKFRSMRWEYSTGPDRPYQSAEEAFTAMGRADLCAEFAAHHKVVDDPRVSRLGRFLRRSSLDELPQLFNVARGELSLVGPRPITAEELVRYGERRASFLALKPGITGLWQVAGRSEVTYPERVKLDVFYVENWSLGLDLTILFRTMRTVTARRGAY
jgi:exopolysaccharide biosynthesis polyprenyl glycosylphosphotransferase